jgi:hypothetical protein
MSGGKYLGPYLATNVISQKYSDMIQRCENPVHKLYQHYGGKGLQVEFTREQFIHWFIDNYPRFKSENPLSRASISRKNSEVGYSLENIEISTVSENTKELYSRRGNPSKWGTKLDEFACLTLYTFPEDRCKFLAHHYQVSTAAVRGIKFGRNRRELYAIIK